MEKTEIKLNITSSLIRFGDEVSGGYNYYFTQSSEDSSFSDMIEDMSKELSLPQGDIFESFWHVIFYYIDWPQVSSEQHTLPIVMCNSDHFGPYLFITKRTIEKISEQMMQRITWLLDK